MFPVWPTHGEFVRIADVANITRTIGDISTGHIIYKSSMKRQNHFAFLDAFDMNIWICIALSFVVLLTINLIIDKNKKIYMKRLWFYLTTLVGSPKPEPNGYGRCLAFVWLLAIFVL